MRPENICDLLSVSDPRVSPDGDRVAFVVTAVDKEANEYRSSIWIGPTDGSSQARQFTSGAKRDASPRWSPNGKWLAFTSARDTDSMQLYVMPLDGGEARRLTDLKAGVDEVAWALDNL